MATYESFSSIKNKENNNENDTKPVIENNNNTPIMRNDITFSKLNNRRIDFVTSNDFTTNTSIDKFTLTMKQNPKNSIKCRFVNKFGGGKSGDTVVIFIANGKSYVLKLFKIPDEYKYKYIKVSENEKKAVLNSQQKEIDMHNNFISLFKGEYIPCPLIYCNGTLTIDGQKPRRYFIMEFSDGIELHYHIKTRCRQEKIKEEYNNVDIKGIILELFYIICKMVLSKFGHCDLHAKNIIIIPFKGKHELDFGKIFEGGPIYTLSNYRLKVIDYGLSSNNTDNEQCKPRSLTKAIVSLRTACDGSWRSSWAQLIKGAVTNPSFGLEGYRENADILFFCNILKAIQSSTKKEKPIPLISPQNMDWIKNIKVTSIRFAALMLLSYKSYNSQRNVLKTILDEFFITDKNTNTSIKRNKNVRTLRYTVHKTANTNNKGTRKISINLHT